MRARAAWAMAPVLLLVLGSGVLVEQHREEGDRRMRAEILTGGNVERGRRLFSSYGCGGCHSLAGVPQARGQVGPPLDGLGSRAFLAGRLENRPDNLMRWIGEPQSVSPGTVMPNLGIPPRDRQDLAAFLYDRS